MVFSSKSPQGEPFVMVKLPPHSAMLHPDSDKLLNLELHNQLQVLRYNLRLLLPLRVLSL